MTSQSDDSSSEDYIDRKSDVKKSNELTPAKVSQKDNKDVITSKRKGPKTKITRIIKDNNPNKKSRKHKQEKSANLDFYVKPATSSASMEAHVSVDSRLDLFEKRVRWQH
jgi:hypothetical protein